MKAYEPQYEVMIVNLRDGIIYEWDLGHSSMTLLKLMKIDNLKLNDLRMVIHIGCRQGTQKGDFHMTMLVIMVISLLVLLVVGCDWADK